MKDNREEESDLRHVLLRRIYYGRIPLQGGFELESVEPGSPDCNFTVDATRVGVSFEQREAAGPWHVVFGVEGTGTGLALSAFAIFNGVFQAVREFVEVRQPETVVFVTKREDLANIYRTYLRREGDTIRGLGYDLVTPQRVEPFLELVLRRIRPSA